MRLAINAAFAGDDKIFNYTDPSLSTLTTEQLCAEIERRIVEHGAAYPCKFVTINVGNEPVGYYFYQKKENILISFGINIKHRASTDLFALIKRELPVFNSYIFSRNTRAINYLKKNGMNVKKADDRITLLAYGW